MIRTHLKIKSLPASRVTKTLTTRVKCTENKTESPTDWRVELINRSKYRGLLIEKLTVFEKTQVHEIPVLP